MDFSFKKTHKEGNWWGLKSHQRSTQTIMSDSTVPKPVHRELIFPRNLSVFCELRKEMDDILNELLLQIKEQSRVIARLEERIVLLETGTR